MRRRRAFLFSSVFGAAGMAAAAIAHVVILTQSRLIGPTGPYAAYRHEGIVTILLAACALLLGCVALSVVRSIDRALGIGSARTSPTLGDIAKIAWPAAAAGTVLAQLSSLFVVESLEQTAQFGHTLGIASAFGAPIPLALVVHVTLGVALATLTRLALRQLGDAGEHLAAIVVPLIRRFLPVDDVQKWAGLISASLPTHVARRLAPLALHIANRPPPHFAVL